MVLEFIRDIFTKEKIYKQLWEEQNIELDKQKLNIHRKNKQIKKLELTIERLENEISDLKARRTSKKSK